MRGDFLVNRDKVENLADPDLTATQDSLGCLATQDLGDQMERLAGQVRMGNPGLGAWWERGVEMENLDQMDSQVNMYLYFIYYFFLPPLERSCLCICLSVCKITLKNYGWILRKFSENVQSQCWGFTSCSTARAILGQVFSNDCYLWGKNAENVQNSTMNRWCDFSGDPHIRVLYDGFKLSIG